MTDFRDVKDGKLVVKYNDLIHARYNVRLVEMKIILFLITKIRNDDPKDKIYTFRIDEFLKVFESKNKNEFKRMSDICDNLASCYMYHPEEPNKRLPFFREVDYTKGEKEVKVVFNDLLQSYLIGLQKKFTWYYLKCVLKLQSPYSIRIYEFLREKANMEIWERTLDVDYLRHILVLDPKYPKYYDFKRRVLWQAQKELEKYTDLAFDFEEIKTGRKVTSIRFIIKPNAPTGKPKPKPRLIPEPQTVPEDSFDWSPFHK